MNRLRRIAGLACAVLIALPQLSYAQAKIKVAIWEVENNVPTSWWFHKEMGGAARNVIDTQFSENSLLSSKFSVVERDKLNLVMKEQGLAASGAVDPASAAKVGRLLGVKYIIIGGIDKFSIDNTKAAVGKFGVGGNMVSSTVTVNLRIVDSTTAERIVSLSAGGEVKKGGGFLKGTAMSRDSEWGIASETIQKAAKAVVDKFVTGEYLARVTGAATPVGGLEGKIIQIDGNKAYINLGVSSGIKVGDKFKVFSLGPALVDPDTGAKLGAPEKQTGEGAVVEVQDKFAIIQFTGAAKDKDTIRKQ